MPLPMNTEVLTNVLPGVGLPIQSSQAAILESVSDALTAHAGGTQAAALALTSKFNVVSTVATAGDSVKLPPAVVGLTVIVVNADSADSMQVFGAGTDTINGVATATGVSQAAGTLVVYRCNAAGKWITGATTSLVTAPTAITADGAVAAHTPGVYVVTKAGVALLTIAAPTTGVDDGVVIEIFSSTNNQHTLTFTGSTLYSGAAGHLTATWPAQLGGYIKIMAYAAKWVLLTNVGTVIT